jgi:hypothetical protein
MKTSLALAIAAALPLALVLLVPVPFIRSSRVVCTMTLRLSKFRISAEQAWHFTRAGYSCGRPGSSGFITPVSTRHQ